MMTDIPVTVNAREWVVREQFSVYSNLCVLLTQQLNGGTQRMHVYFKYSFILNISRDI